MEIISLSDVKKAFKGCNPVVGIGVNAFNRMGPESFLQDYRIVCLSDNLVNELMRKKINILSIEKETGRTEGRRNSLSVLQHPLAKKFLNDLENPYLFFYKLSEAMEKLCRQEGWGMTGMPEHRVDISKKTELRRVAERLDIAVIPGEVVNLAGTTYRELKEKYGIFVVQLPGKSGGKGTFLVKTEKDFSMAKDSEAVVSKFIRGLSPSITGCVTRHGVLCSEVRYQIMDAEACLGRKTFGAFCGHDWNIPVSEIISQKACIYAEKIGEHLKKNGYKGIFGLDMVQSGRELYLVECNPRMLGTFPMYTMLQIMNKEPPLLAFHIAEFMGIDYEIDTRKINKLMQKPKHGAHIILSNRSGKAASKFSKKFATEIKSQRSHASLGSRKISILQGFHALSTVNKGMLKPGVYSSRLRYLRPGYDISELKGGEILLTDGVPRRGTLFKPGQRILKIASLSRMTASGRLSKKFSAIADDVYKGLKMEEYKSRVLKNPYPPQPKGY